jgi:hypothetical protein
VSGILLDSSIIIAVERRTLELGAVTAIGFTALIPPDAG